jgi:hypothetical protein
MLGPEYRTPEYWRQRADDAYSQANRASDAAAKRMLIHIAKMYAAMATRTEFWEAQAALARE